MTVPKEIFYFSPEQGLTFLEHLAHHLTVMVRIASHSHLTTETITHDESRKAMFWINEATHNVVQLTRDLRIGVESGNPDEIAEWIELWVNYADARDYNQRAVDYAISSTIDR